MVAILNSGVAFPELRPSAPSMRTAHGSRSLALLRALLTSVFGRDPVSGSPLHRAACGTRSVRTPSTPYKLVVPWFGSRFWFCGGYSRVLRSCQAQKAGSSCWKPPGMTAVEGCASAVSFRGCEACSDLKRSPSIHKRLSGCS